MREIEFAHTPARAQPVKGIYVMLLAVVLLAACGGEEFQDLQDFVRDSGADLRGQVDPAPEIKPYEPFAYDNSAALPDPFKARKQETKNFSGSGLNQPDLTRPRQELEEYPLEGLKMVGYLRRGKTGNAIIRSTDGKLHRVKAGNYVGMNFGQITSVTEIEVKVKEMVQDGAGDWLERESSLQLVE
jgi:type IV pilus assembly protein PilP